MKESRIVYQPDAMEYLFRSLAAAAFVRCRSVDEVAEFVEADGRTDDRTTSNHRRWILHSS